ncbi:MAG: desulfoferrodoxin [Spirochaetes bacterium]|jgi:superoxide reductase|nr:desulfoferrodoxin [Spirochaetota bacterium]
MKRLFVYKCEVCGNVVEVMSVGGGTLSCCDQDMVLMEEKSADSSTEKHVPIIESIENGVRVTVGSIEHPMTEEHYIQWIEVLNGDWVNRKYLAPGQKPQAEFYVPFSDSLIAREFCNVHKHWKSK